MNEADSAGGGHQGLSPAPPAVADRRSTAITTGTSAVSTAIAASSSLSSSSGLPNSTHPTPVTFHSGSNSNQQRQHQENLASSGSAVSSSIQQQHTLSHHRQQQQPLFISSTRYSSNERIINHHQQQQQSQRTLLTPNQRTLSSSSSITLPVNNSSGSNSSTSSSNFNLSNVNLGVARTSSSSSNNSVNNNSSNVTSSSYANTSNNLATRLTSGAVPYSISSTAGINIPSSQTISSNNNQSSENSAVLTSAVVASGHKRLKVDTTSGQQSSSTPTSSSSSSSSSTLSSTSTTTTTKVNIAAGDVNTLKKLLLERKYPQLKEKKELYTDYVAELFFLRSGGNMMEYPGWRKKPPTSQFTNFTKSFRIETYPPKIEDSSKNASQESNVLISTTTTTTTTSITTTTTASLSSSSQSTTQGPEIKIPGVGATPIAVSTTLPAAVVQLTQQGHIPGRPQGGRHGMVFGQIPVPPTVGNSSVPLVPGGTPIVPEIAAGVTEKRVRNHSASISSPVAASSPVGTIATANGIQEQFSVKAKQEVYVMQRISELQREGLWTEKRLPKLQEPTRPKAHWDYLLEEMVWLAADFAQERKWKKTAAKKCARMVQKYFHDKANAAQKAEKAQELHLKRVAAFIAKEIKLFWSNVEKLVEYKHQTKLEEKRKKALDQHLSFIVDQTEKFSQQLAEGMNKPAITAGNTDVSAVPSVNSSQKSSPKRENQSDEEFRPQNESSDDDEETIAKAEAEAQDVNEEIAALQRESQMELDDFLKELPKDYLENRDKIVVSENESSNSESASGDEEFEADENSSDDEDTIMEQEKTEKNVDHKKELDELNEENKMSIEELMAKYKGSKDSNKNSLPTKMEIDSDDEEEETELDSDDDDAEESEEEEEEDEESSEDETMNSTSEAEGESQVGLKSLFADENKSQTDKDDLINDAAALAESIQPKGNTLSSTNVVTPVPFLLKHSLREYQHIGLDWLVTMHDRKLNGILADEMGLGKTIQTIALLAHLACVKGNWGPHLIVVPSSVMLNWEMEFKKWCPGFKILTYYGTQKERKQKRIGWTKFNAFHVCITSYKLVIQDQQSFRRKKWKYLILDEAQNIKNFKSQRWQLLLNFQTEQRLLLTGTPLQNNLMELWSLMHFLMPHVFQSHREFKEWFSNPMTGMIEGNSEYNDSIIKRLHKVLRPFLLRRLKSEVEKQMPKKYEHVVMCRLSKRQRYLYDDFMSRARTRETLATGNLLSVINVLMQLRKVCNHPNLFEVRPTISPFRMEGITFRTSSMVYNILDYDPFKAIDLTSLNLVLIQLELCLTAYVSYKTKKLEAPKKLIEEIDSLPEQPPKCPSGKYKFYVRIKDTRVQENLVNHSNGVKVGTSPVMKTEGNKLVPIVNVDKKQQQQQATFINRSIATSGSNATLTGLATGSTINLRRSIASTSESTLLNPAITTRLSSGGSTTTAGVLHHQQPTQIAQIVQTTTGRHIVLTPATYTTNVGGQQQRITVVGKSNYGIQTKSVTRSTQQQQGSNNQNLVVALAQQLKTNANQQQQQQHIKVIPKSESKDEDEELFGAELEQFRKEGRRANLKFLASLNHRRCDAVPIYGDDCRKTIEKFMRTSHSINNSTWYSRSHINSLNSMHKRDNWSLTKMILSYEERIEKLNSLFDNFIIHVPAVSAPSPYLEVTHHHPSKVNEEKAREFIMHKELSPKLALLHRLISATNTQFPDPRLIQYDCGKLQTLDLLLRKLKTEGHRALIFTQMTKMLDVLEAFLNYHGHIYLRLDGTTRIDQRQLLMERFNGDKRIFAFILSTRSGGVGVNLTGADTVIFYDSDWNPTMDAQAQDRCHRIGQTRDVHIYRLVSEKTIEENILKKANQKRLLGDLAIEGGNFTTAYFKSSTIQDLFNVENEGDASMRLAEVLDRDRERKQKLQENLQQQSGQGPTSSGGNNGNASSSTSEEKGALGIFESALASAEDEQDVQAAKIAKAEAAADLAEFDENIPLEETEAKPELSKADQEVENLVKQLSPIERYAMKFVEETGGSWTAEQLKAAEAEIEQQKREWEANRLAALQKEEEMRRLERENEELLTYSREDAKNQIWISENTMEKMPMWCPPTPPQNDNDIYIDHALSFLYETDIMPESHLPPVYVKKEYKRSRTEAGFFSEGRRPPKIRKEDNYFAPRSLFDRPSPALAKIRRDLKQQRYRGVFKPNVQIPGLKQQMPLKTLLEPEGMVEWSIYEDIAILHVLQNLQGLPLNLMLLSPGHTPNWDLVAEIVNQYSRTYRSPKQCRYRYEAVIVPREEGKLLESPKKQKKLKSVMKAAGMIKGGVKSLRTSQLFISDNNNSFTKLMKIKFDNIKSAYLKKRPVPTRFFGTQTQKNSKHVAVLNEFGITNYDNPLTPVEIANRKAEKMKEKQRAQMQLPTQSQQSSEVVQQSAQQVQHHQQLQLQQQSQLQQHQVQQSQQIQQQQQQQQQQLLQVQQQQAQQQSQPQQISVQQQPTAIVVQQAGSVNANTLQQQGIQQVAQIMQASPIQARTVVPQAGSNIAGTATAVHPSTAQIVKAIVTPSSTIVTGSVQHITQQNAQQVQLQQASIQTAGGGIVTPSSVSVVLTTPVSTLSTVQPNSQSAQIVSIQQNNVPSSSGMVQSQSNSIPVTATIVQTISSQSLPQVVSVSQLATVGTVLTTSAGLQPNTTVATLNASTLRAQRLVATPGGTLQEVVLQQRSSSQSPTIVSMSGLGTAQGVTQAQLQAAQLRLSMANAQQVSGVVTKGISVGSLQQAGKITNQPTQIQLYRQQALRQQLKVLQASSAQGGGATAVVQTAGGQTALVNATGTIIQGAGLVPAGQTVQVQGQKVSVATVSASNVGAGAGSSGVVTSVATVQVAPGQGRPTQFIKQVGVGGKQTITRQVTDSEMLLVKRQLIGQHKTQVIPQAQIFAPANVQVQQASTSGQQQIATLVKTSSGTAVATATGGSVGTVGMALSQIKPGGQIKVTMANQNQVRQLQLQQQLAIAQQQRKVGKMTQIAQVTGKGGVPTQLIVQNPKTLPGSVTVQQIQQVIGRQPGTLATTGQIVLGKTNVGRVIPVSVASQANARQTIQVVSAASAQALAASNIRAHVAGAQNIAGTIKVATGATQVQTQQALIALQQSQQNQRQNASPVRLQTTSGGSLVAVTVHQPASVANQISSSQQQTSGGINTTSAMVVASGTGGDMTNITQQTTQQQAPK